jgi:hypothetical protein
MARLKRAAHNVGQAHIADDARACVVLLPKEPQAQRPIVAQQLKIMCKARLLPVHGKVVGAEGWIPRREEGAVAPQITDHLRRERRVDRAQRESGGVQNKRMLNVHSGMKIVSCHKDQKTRRQSNGFLKR